MTEADLIGRFAAVWPHYFANGEALLLPPERVGVESSIGTNRSLSEHFERRTLARGLPPGRGLRCARRDIPDCGHFPWLERPQAFRAAMERLVA